MAEQAYGYVLWLRKPHRRLLGDQAVASGDWFFDRASRQQVTAALDELIGRHGKDDTGRDGYRLELLDPVTREHVCDITPLEPALNGASNSGGSVLRLQDVTDEALAYELLRRLAGHR